MRTEFELNRDHVWLTNELKPLPLLKLTHSILAENPIWNYFIGDYSILKSSSSDIKLQPIFGSNKFQFVDQQFSTLVQIGDLLGENFTSNSSSINRHYLLSYLDHETNVYGGIGIVTAVYPTYIEVDFFNAQDDNGIELFPSVKLTITDELVTTSEDPDNYFQIIYPECFLNDEETILRTLKKYNGIFHPELDLLLHESYKYLENFYPDHPDFGYVITNTEIDLMLKSWAAIIGYNPDYKFLAKLSESESLLQIRDKKKELKWKIRDIENIAFHRKFYGSYIGYKMVFASIERHGSIYLTGKYDTTGFNKNYGKKFRLVDLAGLNSSIYSASRSKIKDQLYFTFQANSTTLIFTNIFDIERLKVGDYIVQTNAIPADTYIISIDSSFITISNETLIDSNESGSLLTFKSTKDSTDFNAIPNILEFKYELYNDKDKIPDTLDFLYPNTRYPYTGYIEGLKDISLYQARYSRYDSGLLYDDTVTLNKFDQIRSILVDKVIFLDLTIDKVLTHVNSKGGISCLCDLDWLEYLEEIVNQAKRASEVFFIGAQLNMVTDNSGFYAKGTESYTHKDTKIKFIAIPQNYKKNQTPGYVRLGRGGFSSNVSLFQNTSSIIQPIIMGTSIYGLHQFQDENSFSSNTINTSDLITTLNLEDPVFESPISEYEYESSIGGDYQFIQSTVYCQEFKNIESTQNIKLNSDLSIYTDAIAAYNPLDPTDIEIQTVKDALAIIQTDITLPRRFLTKGSCSFLYMITPELELNNNSNLQLNYVYKKDGYYYTTYNDIETKLDFDSAFDSDYYVLDLTSKVKYSSNPFWQFLEIKDVWDSITNQWTQSAKILKHKKIDTAGILFYVFEDITNTEEAFVTISKGHTIADSIESGKNIITVSNNLNYINHDEGTISFILTNNNSIKGTTIIRNGLTLNIPTDVQTQLNDSTYSVTAKSVNSFIINTTRNLSNKLDKKSAIVAITEAGIFNTDDELIAYAIFPPVIYNSFNNHLSLNCFIKQNPIYLLD